MSDSIKQLIEKVQSDQELQNKFKACTSAAEQVKLANELGYEITAEEFEQMNKDLSDEQLDEVAGGCCIIHFS